MSAQGCNLNPAVDRSFFNLTLSPTRHFLHYLTFTFWVSSLQSGLYDFCVTWPRCNSLEWGAPKRGPRAHAKGGTGQRWEGNNRFGRLHPAPGSHLPTEGTAPL